MKALFGALLALVLCAAAPADARIRLTRTPAAAPAIGIVPGNGAGWSGVTAVPSAQGNPADSGYGDQAIAKWDTVPGQTIEAGQTLYVGIVAFHQATVLDQLAGVASPRPGSNIDHITVQADGGTSVTTSVATTNPQTGVFEYVFAIRATDFATDGAHTLRATVYPSTGQPLVLQGAPGISRSILATISGTTLTVPAGACASLCLTPISVGQAVMASSVANGTIITGFGTGSGGEGTYTINNSQTVSTATYMSFGDAPEFAFFTNGGNTKPVTIKYVSTTGNDTTGTGSSASPYATVNKAKEAINTAMGGDAGGGVICVQAGTYTSSNPLGNGSFDRTQAYRWLNVQRANDAPCDGVNAGAVAFTGGQSTNDLSATKLHLKDISVAGSMATSTSQSSLWFDGVTWTGPGMNVGNSKPYGGQWQTGVYATDSDFSNSEDGLTNALLIRNSNFHHIAADAISTARAVTQSTGVNLGNVLGTGTTTAGSPVISGAAWAAHLQAAGDGEINDAARTVFPVNTTVLSVNVGANTVTMNANALTTGSATFDVIGEHGDEYQVRGNNSGPPYWGLSNIILYKVDMGSTTNLGPEGFLFDGAVTNFAVVDGKWWVNTGAQVMQIDSSDAAAASAHKNLFFSGNLWTGLMLIRNTTTVTDWLWYGDTCDHTSGAYTGVTYFGGTCH